MNDSKMKYEIYLELLMLVSEKFEHIKLESYAIYDGLLDGYRLFHSDEKDHDYYVFLNMFHYIFSLGEKGKIYLWDELKSSIINPYYEKPKIYREDFTKEELSFIDEIMNYTT